ncbi:hypothetical protein N005_03295 [Pseudomonas mediterranea CFBP 5447]|nr:hypothetical protein N005_03295 [Pseudomonas mediterranea CFBP 5447]
MKEGDPEVAFFHYPRLLFLAYMQDEMVIDQLEAILFSNCFLQFFDFRTDELDNLTGFHIYHVVVVLPVRQFKDRMTAIEIMASHEAGSLELGQNTVNRGQTDVLACFHEGLVDVFGTHVPLLSGVEHLQNFDPWQCHLEAGFA